MDAKKKSDREIKVRMFGESNPGVKTNFTEYYWNFYLKKNGATIDTTKLSLESNSIGLAFPYTSCPVCSGCYMETTDDNAILDVGSNPSPGTYVISGSPGPSNKCRLVARTGGSVSFNVDGIVTNITIKYSGNGGTGSVPSQTVKPNAEMTTNPNSFTRKGYTFYGWNTKANGSGVFYGEETNGVQSKVKFSQNTTLYAYWVANNYGLMLDPNGGKIEGSTNEKDLSVTYDSTYNNSISSLLPTNGEWTFKGYSINKLEYPVTKTANDEYKKTDDLVYNSSGVATNNAFKKSGSAQTYYYFYNNKWNYDFSEGDEGIKKITLNDGTTKDVAVVYAKWTDETAPTIDITNYNPPLTKEDGSINYTNKDVAITIKVGDQASGLSRVDLVKNGSVEKTIKTFSGENDSTFIYTTDKNLLASEKYQFIVYDRVGNSTVYNLNVNNIDKEDPKYDIYDENSNLISCGSEYDSNGTIVIKAQDIGVSGIDELEYQLNYVDQYGRNITTQVYCVKNTNTSDPLAPVSASIQMPVSGATHIMVKVTDRAGNVTYTSLNDCIVTFNKTQNTNIQLVDYSYVFKLYDESKTSAGFISKLEGDKNTACQNALKYIQIKIKDGYSELNAVKDFLKVYNYEAYSKNK